MLDRIPPEVLSQIAYHLILPTFAPPVPLLQTCRAIHDALLPTSNPRLYSTVYRAAFDVRAPARRTAEARDRRRALERARGVWAAWDRDSKVVIEARALTMELEHRVRALRRLEEQVGRNDLRKLRDDEVWVVYLLLVENDGRNIHHLAFLPKFLHLFHTQHLLPACLDAGYPTESVMTSLAMWVAWLYSHNPEYRNGLRCGRDGHGSDASSDGHDGAVRKQTGRSDKSASGSDSTRARSPPHSAGHGNGSRHAYGHSIEDRAEQQYMLRAYVFAAHRFSMYFAPWSAVQVPLPPVIPAPRNRTPDAQPAADGSSDIPPAIEGGAAPPEAAPAAADDEHEFMADLRPVDRGVEVEWYGTKLRLSPPVLSHAAILRFFDTRGEDDDDINEDADDDEDENENETEADAGGSAHGGSRRGRRRTAALLSSHTHDRDWARLVQCANPRATPGLPPSAWRGAFAGAWEGNFSFFEFEAYSNMLAGQTREVYTGPFGAQRQVWKLHETYVRRKRTEQGERVVREQRERREWEKKMRDAEREDARDAMDVDGAEGGNGHAASTIREAEGGIDAHGNLVAALSTPSPPAPFPLRGPSTNAGFPLDLPSTLSDGLASARAEEAAMLATVRQQVEAMEGFEAVPEDELAETLAEADAGERDVEVLLTGTGHSAWGRFLLKGRVRSWDGMASLVKEYAPHSRGKWLYRGYVLAGDVMVGRWRDTHTPDEYVGYEGTYILNRRG